MTTVADLNTALAALRQFGEVAMPVPAAVAVAKQRGYAEGLMQPYTNVHNDLVRKHSGGGTQVPPGSAFEAFSKEAMQVLDQELELECVEIEASGIDNVPPNLLWAMRPLVRLI